MIEVVPFQVEHIAQLPNMAGQESLVAGTADLHTVTATGVHRSVMADSRPVACLGVARIHDYRGFAWAILSEGTPRAFPAIHRAALWVLDTAPFHRIETYVDPLRQQDSRWVRMLGFRLETPYKPFIYPDGRGASEWVLLK